jgi:hypothetical protein
VISFYVYLINLSVSPEHTHWDGLAILKECQELLETHFKEANRKTKDALGG